MRGRRGPEGQPAESRGQTETIGVVLVLSMTLIGATIALAFGASGLDAARLDTQEGSIEHAMTQLDSRSAMVALGDSTTQRVRMSGTGEGSYRIDPDSGWMNVTHHEYDGGPEVETVYNESLGALVYENGDKRIAYQGGGVWVAEGGSSRMISPPEFHYQSATLTLPVIRVDGGASAGGSGITARIVRTDGVTRVYPSSTTYDATGAPYQNPVREGNVTVTVKSDFYQAWANYFRTRTSGNVTVDHDARTASVKLISPGTFGAFTMPSDGNAIEIRGLGEGHSISEFEITLRPDDLDDADFSNLQWTLYAEKSSQRFEIHLRDSGKNNTLSSGDCTVRDVAATVYYSDSSGDPYHGWYDDNAFNTECDDLNGDGTNESFLVADLVGPTPLTMEPLSGSQLQHFSASGDDLVDSATFDEHDDVDWETGSGTTFAPNDQTSIGNLTNHYLALMGPTVELTVEDKGSDTVNEQASSGNFQHDGGSGQFVTFLHITENRVVIELE